MNRFRVEELWLRSLAGESLPDTDSMELLAALEAEPLLRQEILQDEQLDRTLKMLVRCQKTEDAFVTEVVQRLAVDADGQIEPAALPFDPAADWQFTLPEPDLDLRRRRHWLPLAALLTTAAALAVAVLSLLILLRLGFFRPGTDIAQAKLPTAPVGPVVPTELRNTVAKLSRATDGAWEGEPRLGSRLGVGPITIREGVVTISFDSGAEVDVSGPATFELVSAREGFLRRGKLRALVSERARGFRIETPTSVIVDLGTEFAVAVDPLGTTDVQVHQGIVELEARTPAAAAPSRWRLLKGDSRRIEALLTQPSKQGSFHGVLNLNGERREFTDRAEFEKAQRQMLEDFRRLQREIMPMLPTTPGAAFKGVLSINGQHVEFDSPEEFEKARQKMLDQVPKP